MTEAVAKARLPLPKFGRGSRLGRAMCWAVFLVMALVVVYPVSLLIYSSFLVPVSGEGARLGIDNWLTAWGQAGISESIFNTLRRVAATEVIAFPSAIALTWLVTRTDLPGKKPLVTGGNKFCVTDIAFEIQGRNDCKKRGMREVGFAETNVKGADGYVAKIGPAGLIATPARRNSSSASASRRH